MACLRHRSWLPNCKAGNFKGIIQGSKCKRNCTVFSAYGINTIANYIVVFPDDNYQTMNETLSLVLELNTEMINIYSCQALPGSPFFQRARQEKWDLPSRYDEYAFLSYNSKPLSTKYLGSAQVLEFRDHFWHSYFTNPAYLNLVEQKFGEAQRMNVEEMAAFKLRRALLND